MKKEEIRVSFLNFLTVNMIQIIVVGVVGSLLVFFSFVPYLNLFFSLQRAIYHTFFLTTILFKVGSGNLVKFGLLILVISIPFYLFPVVQIQEITANMAFLSFLVSLFKSILVKRPSQRELRNQ